MRKSPKMTGVVYGFGEGEKEYFEQLAKSEVKVLTGEGNSTPTEKQTLAKSILNILDGDKDNIHRLAFETDPSQVNNFAGVYHAKLRLVPDSVLKRIAIQDSLVAAIVRARQNHLTSFGRPRPDRFSSGFIIKPNTGVLDELDEQGKKEFADKIDRAIRLLSTCGHVTGVPDEHQKTFAEYLGLSARSAVVCGRIATEVVWVEDPGSDKKRFSHFVCTDAGTIYKATTDKTGQDSIRKDAYNLLCRLTGQPLKEEKWNHNEYSWVQVIDGTPKQVFTNDEMKVYNFYPVPDVELDGYPVTPIDTVITAITTHINITTHNKLYFQSGRATRGMLVIKSDDVSPQMIHQIKQQFNASINSSANAWRMPCFGVPTDSELNWQAIDAGGGRDMEFQYLTDMNAREILTSFMMSPDELPGWSYLSRGTASQALSECIASQSRILTSTGLICIGDFVGSGKEKEGEFWSGKGWVKGRAFRSGTKHLVETELACGIKLQTSPDHRFRIIDDCGELAWKRQSELSVGDGVLTNRKPVDGFESLVPSFRGKKLTVEIAEILGWMTGDGCLVAPRKRVGAQIQLFYHPEKEGDVWDSQFKTLSEFGINTKHFEKKLSDVEIEKVKADYGFRHVASRRIKNLIYDTDFYRWLIDLGFSPSSRGANSKTIPPVFSILPVEYRAAFLRGLFSADGGKLNKSGSVCLTVQNDRLRDQVRQLMMSLGIRTLPCKGIKRPERQSLTSIRNEGQFSYKLNVKDRDVFWNLVGFIQPHKQLDNKAECWNIDRPSPAIIKKCLEPCVLSTCFVDLDRRTRDNIKNTLKGTRSCSYQYLSRSMSLCGITPPSWFNDYYLESVVSTKGLEQDVEMYDVEMYDNIHAFVVEGVVTHNSNQEYKLEAARDVGIRPLLSSFEDFINAEIFPLIDADLAKKSKISLVGLDAMTPEKEATQLETGGQVYMTFDDILQKVEKKPVGKAWAGEFPLNPVYKAYLDQFFTVGAILEQFCGIKGASKDPQWAYVHDPMWFQWQQFRMQMQQAQQQAQQGQPPPGGGQGGGEQPQQDGSQGQSEPTRQNQQDDQTENQRSDQQEQSQNKPAGGAGAGELGKAVSQAFDLMSKSENNLPPEKRKILDQHRKTVKFLTDGFERDVKDGVKEILDIAEQLGPRK
jgi:hypothetical protein